MRSRTLILVVALILAVVAAGITQAADNKIIINRLFNARTCAANSTIRSVPINLENYKPGGYFSLHVVDLTGTGTAKITYEISNNRQDCASATYVTPTSASDIVTAHTATSGPGSDGNDLYAFTPEIAKCLRIIVEETGDANPVVITADLAVQ